MKKLLLIVLVVLKSSHIVMAQATKADATAANQEFSQAPPVAEPRKNVHVDVRFSGIKGVQEEDLRTAAGEIISSIEARGLTPPRADDVAFYVEVYYRRHGYGFALVDWKITNDGRALELNIVEGPLTTVGEITYQGNDHYPNMTLNDFLLGTTRERFSKFLKVLPYVEQDIDTGVSRLESFYHSEGYLDAKVVPWPVGYSADLSVASLGVSVVEGLQYWFRRIDIVGASPELEAKIRLKLADILKAPATELRMDSMQSEIQFQLKSEGYFKAEVALTDVTFDKEHGLVDLKLVVNTGYRFIFDGVSVRGTERLKPNFIPKRFSSLTGQTYDPEKMNEIYREMVSTGLFSEFRLKETPIDGNQIRLDIVVKENSAKEFGLYGGFGTYEGGFVGATFQDRNLFGNGRPLLTSIEMSQRGLTGRIEYVDPWFIARGNELRLRIFSRSIDNDGYSIFDLGVRGELNRKFTKNFKAALYAELKTSQASPIEIDPVLLGPLDYQTLTLGISGTLDFRNNPLAPGEGWVTDASLGYEQISSGGGGIRAALRVSYYLPIGKGLLALGGRTAAFITSSDVNDVPIDERYFNGGGTTVRSFDERQLGPLYLNTYPLGGLSRTTLNAEFQYPIFGDIKGAAFIDAGNVPADGSFFSTSDFRYGVGLGLRYNLPVGPLRLDYGINPDPRPGESGGAFHFSFGVAF